MAPKTGLDINLERITDVETRASVVRLLNLVEELAAELREARAEIQRLRDEINRLKGEQGKPEIRPQATVLATDHSSERERREPKPRVKRSKKTILRIDREVTLPVDRATLPADAVFKGYAPVVVQDVVFRTETTRFRKEVWYSALEGKTYRAPLPAGYQGQFGPKLKAFVLAVSTIGLMSEGALLSLLRSAGLLISAGTLSDLLIKNQDLFHDEKAAVVEAGLRSTPWQHTDDTATRVNGQNEHCHVLCNPLFTAYFTLPGKDRLTVLDVLRGGAPRVHRVTPTVLSSLAHLGVPAGACTIVKQWPHDQDLSADRLTELLRTELPWLGQKHQHTIAEATALAAYHDQSDWPVIETLVCDDAPQFKSLTETRSLCWVHEGRHYQKLTPYLAHHQRELTHFRRRFWSFYRDLLAYQDAPIPAGRIRLRRRFDRLFGTVTGYAALDARIAATRAKKTSLLLVLDHPELPLHNNSAELAARRRVRKRDVSFGPRTRDGTNAWDTFQSLAATAQKLGISFYDYLQDRIGKLHQIPPLADLIADRARDHNLGASWPGWPLPGPRHAFSS